MPKNKKLALDSGIQTNQILTNDDEVYIPRLSSILLAVTKKSIVDINNALQLVNSFFIALAFTLNQDVSIE